MRENNHQKNLVIYAKKAALQLRTVAHTLLKNRLSKEERLELHNRLLIAEAGLTAAVDRVDNFASNQK